MKPFTHHTVQELQLLKFLADEKWGDVLSTVSAYNKYNTSILRKSLNHTTNFQKSVEDDSFQSIILYFINVAIRLIFYHFFKNKLLYDPIADDDPLHRIKLIKGSYSKFKSHLYCCNIIHMIYQRMSDNISGERGVSNFP